MSVGVATQIHRTEENTDRPEGSGCILTGVSIDTLTREMLMAKSELGGRSAAQLINGDYKKFEMANGECVAGTVRY